MHSKSRRDGRSIAATIQNVADTVMCIPKTLNLLNPILTSVPLQLFAYHM